MSGPQVPTLAKLRVIWRALLGSLAVYAALPWLFQPEGGTSIDALLLGFIALSVLTGVGTLLAREFLVARPIRSGDLRVDSSEGMARVSQISMVLWALSESVGLYGFILYALSGESRYLYLFLMASAGLFFAHRPGRWPASS